MKKYRLIKEVNNAANGYTQFIIEKRVRFLFWSWWSTNYLVDTMRYYSFSDEAQAFNMLQILNGEKEWYTTSYL